MELKTIALFPGQGSQYPGMGSKLAEDFSPAARLLEEADDTLGFSLSKIMSDGSEDDLKKTENTQPALFTASMMSLALAREEGLEFQAVAGHSLGEYSAVCAAGGMDFATGLKLVRRRGELMAQAGEKAPGNMAAILGADLTLISDVLENASATGVVITANFNCPGQIVISGTVEGVGRACEIFGEAGKKTVLLPVSGAFHSPLMEFAVPGLKEAVESSTIGDLDVPLIANVTADVVQSGEEVKNLLVRQLTSPVLWSLSLEKAMELGAKNALELGAGKVLMGLARKISRDLKVFPVEDCAGLQKAKEKINA